jgi:hypothetical protein
VSIGAQARCLRINRRGTQSEQRRKGFPTYTPTSKSGKRTGWLSLQPVCAECLGDLVNFAGHGASGCGRPPPAQLGASHVGREVSLPQCQYSAPQRRTAVSNELLARLHAQPGLQDSALAAPLRIDRQGLFMEGRSLSSGAAGIRHAVDSCLKALASRREKMYRLAAEIHQIT